MDLETIIDFFNENIILFVIGAAIIVMAIIGYFAEKNVFNVEKQQTGMNVSNNSNNSEVKDIDEKIIDVEEEKTPKEKKEPANLDKTESIDLDAINEEVKKQEDGKKEEDSEQEADDVWNF